MDIVRIAAVGIITALCVMIVRENRPDIALVIGIAGGVTVLLSVVGYMRDTFGFFEGLIEKSGVDRSMISVLVKVVGIGYIADFAAGIAEESGSKSLADKIVLGGKVMIFAASLPVVKLLFEIVTALVS